MHPKYWKFPGGQRFQEQANDADGQGQGAGGTAEPTEAEKAAAAAAAVAATEKAAVADKAGAPSDAEAKLIKEVMQKKEALKVATDEAAAAKARLQEFDGIDPAAVRKLLAEQKTAEEAALAAKGDFETLKTRMAEEHTKVTTTLQDQIKDVRDQLAAKDRIIDELSIGTQFSQSNFITEETTMPAAKARKLFGEHFDVVEGKVVAFDKPRGEANRTPLVDQLGNGLAFNEAMRKIVESDPDKDHLLKSKVKSGAGSQSKADTKVQLAAPGDATSVDRIGAGLKGLLSNMPTGAM